MGVPPVRSSIDHRSQAISRNSQTGQGGRLPLCFALSSPSTSRRAPPPPHPAGASRSTEPRGVPVNTAVMLDPHELRARIPHDVFDLPLFRTLGKALLLAAAVLGLLAVATVSDSLLVKVVVGFVAGVPLFTLAAVGH